MTEQFDFRDWEDGGTVQLGPFTVTSVLVDHPVPAYAIRVATEHHSLVYSGDTGPTEALADLAGGADLFLCEASFVESGDNPPNLHLTGAEAGDLRDPRRCRPAARDPHPGVDRSRRGRVRRQDDLGRPLRAGDRRLLLSAAIDRLAA